METALINQVPHRMTTRTSPTGTMTAKKVPGTDVLRMEVPSMQVFFCELVIQKQKQLRAEQKKGTLEESYWAARQDFVMTYGFAPIGLEAFRKVYYKQITSNN
jgi:hypothetical protein